MQLGGEAAVSRELAKEIRSLRAKLGARQLGGRHGDERHAPDRAQGRVSGVVDHGDEGVNLLWPAGRPQTGLALYDSAVHDLELSTVVRAIALGDRSEHGDLIQRVLYELCGDPEVIRYRQAIVADLIRDPELARGIEELLPLLDRLNDYSMTSRDMPELFQVAWWLGELETYVDCIEALVQVFARSEGEPASEGLCALRDLVLEIQARDSFQDLRRELPPLLSRIRGVMSITIGINLNQDLQPVAATLLSLNEEPFTEAPLLKLLLGGSGEQETVMPLHTVRELSGAGGRMPGDRRPNPMLIPLFRDLSRVMEQVSKPVAAALEAYVDVNRRWLLRLHRALAFYSGAAQMVRRLQAAGLPLCCPVVAPMEDRVCQVADSYNVNLALQLLAQGVDDLTREVITNDIALDEDGRIIVLTGPNRGGKTTYTQGVGLVQVLAQAGLFVPGSEALISPVDNVYTHFPSEEELVKGTGRFGDEAQRLRELFARATRHSLVLLNESLSGTYAGESLYLARDVVRILRLLGARVVFATHLHELAERVEAINDELDGDSLAVSMVSSRIDQEAIAQGADEVAERRTYKVIKGP
ncbi:MAG: hypothetical protein M8467_13550, partial [Anaerolineae bacterium]|nr:hypothetical protein [Anaerolineae bacterium]